jgi:hypothetical protein
MSATNHPESLGPSDLLAAWQHYEVLAADDKNRMIATVSWLIGLSVALTTAAVAELVDLEGADYSAIYALAIGSIFLAVLAVYFVKAFSIHSHRKYEQSEKVREVYARINPSDVALFFGDTYHPRKIYILSERVGQIFDICFILSIAALIASFTVLLWAYFR